MELLPDLHHDTGVLLNKDISIEGPHYWFPSLLFFFFCFLSFLFFFLPPASHLPTASGKDSFPPLIATFLSKLFVSILLN